MRVSKSPQVAVTDAISRDRGKDSAEQALAGSGAGGY
jgi:hypothetical protein